MAKRVLVIDDEAVIHTIVAAFLEPAGFQVLAAERGKAGLALASAQPPDLVLLDLMMPEMDGYAVCRALRQRPETRQVPVIMMTSSDDPALTRSAYDAGVQVCVPKPFRREALLAAIQAVEAWRPGTPS